MAVIYLFLIVYYVNLVVPNKSVGESQIFCDIFLAIFLTVSINPEVVKLPKSI